MLEALEIKISGIVQGVGFRPFVYRMASEYLISGWVLNNTEGVYVHAEGEADNLDKFIVQLSEHAPAAARVEQLEIHETEILDCSGFEIRFSDSAQAEETTLVSPDLATCAACAEELLDPSNRRYRYPFINCTNCGPRFTIMNSLPYDRPVTSMSEFAMCPTCQEEYDNPANRRFHAQPNACFECGPELGFLDMRANPQAATSEASFAWAHSREESDAMLAATVACLREGGIAAVKGLGGYHLVCDAANEGALAALRARKRRPGKAFAVMVSSVEEARAWCEVNEAEAKQLESPARPIVLLKKRAGVSLAAGLADALPELGVMLPATPVQHLLMHDFGGMLVMTSGNVHEEPIVISESDAVEKLGSIAHVILANNRQIVGRYDDSVLRVLEAGAAGSVIQVVRRARGLAPVPLSIPVSCPEGEESASNAPSVLAVGPEQKNTLTLTRGASAFTSQHVGDMESVATMDAWEETLHRYEGLFQVEPAVIARDHHPEYLTSKWAESQAAKAGLSQVKVQHHHAHVLSVMGENALEGPVCGIAFDGTGYGLDGAIWGGEVLLANTSAFERFANFVYIPLPGGAAAIKEPARIAYGALWSFDLLDHPAAESFVQRCVPGAQTFEQMIEQGLNAPMTSSVGRLFDAVSALLGICTKPTYEGEAAILLEAAVHEGLAAHNAQAEAQGAQAAASMPVAPDGQDQNEHAYQITVIKNTATETSTATDTSVLLLDPAPLFGAMLDDLQANVPVHVIARRFHDAVVEAVVTMAELVRAMYGINVVTLSGGVFMNRYLTEHALIQLQEAGFTVALNKELPPNDASISYGQAVLALAAPIKE